MNTITINKGYKNEKIYEVSPVTVGSEKQISWADQIKIKKIGDIFGMISEPGYSQHAEKITEACDKMNAIVDAKFWIDNRNNLAKNILKNIG